MDLTAGKGFVAQYYLLFDDPNQRNSLVNMYNVSIDEFRKVPKILEVEEIAMSNIVTLANFKTINDLEPAKLK